MGRLAKHWFLLALAVGLTVSLLFPRIVLDGTLWLSPRVVIAAALFLMAATMPSRNLWDEVRRPGAVFFAVGMSYVVAPLLGWGISGWVAPDFSLGLLISASVPCTLASGVLWTRMAGGNEATALLVTLFTTFTSWLITPAWLLVTAGKVVDLPLEDMMGLLIISLVVPVSLGQAARLVPVLAQVATHRRTFLGVLSQLFILVIILQAAARAGERLQMGDVAVTLTDVVLAIGLVLLLHLAILTIGWRASAWIGFARPRRIAIAFAGSQKTLPVAFLLYERYFQAEYPLAILPVLAYHVGQLLVDTPIAGWLHEKAPAA